MKCPCKDCLCVPICSNKLYFKLFSECCLINKYVKKSNNDNNSTLKTTQNILQSPWWKVSGKSNITIRLDNPNQKEY